MPTDTLQKPLVPSSGPLTCKLALVGEAPGQDELTEGRPFCGKSGKLLDQWLALVGLDREKCYTTNVVKEHPYRNEISPFIASKDKTVKGLKSTVVVTSPAYDAHEAALWEELRACEANVFVALGNVALYALTRKWGIQKFRGSILECTAPGLEGRKVIPTIHPAASLRQPTTKYLTLHDLQKAHREQAFPEVKRPEVDLLLDLQFKDVIHYLQACMTQPCVGFDIETTVQVQGSKKVVKEMFMFSVALPTEPITSMAVSLVNPDGSSKWSIEDECYIMECLAEVLQNPNVVKVGQNLIFDSTVLYERYGIQCWPIDDTMVAHKIVYPEFKADLGHITSMYTDWPYYKDTGGKFFDGKSVVWEDFLRYSAMDSVICVEAMPQLKRDLERQGNLDVYDTHIQVHRPILYMQAKGYKVDVEAKEKIRREVLEEIKAQKTALDAIVTKHYGPKKQKEKLNVKSVPQLKAFFKDLGITLPKTHGKESTDKKAINKLVVRGVPEAKMIAALKQIRDDYSKYWNARLREDRVHGNYKPHGTMTGRFSSTMTIWGDGSNAQNRPPKFKALVRRDPGHLPIVIDLSQAENRNTAYLANELRMIAAFESGQDVHRLTAGLLFGKRPEDISNEKGSCPLGGGAYSERFWGKKANHSLNYDIGPEEFALTNELPLKEAKWMIAAYHRAYPNVRAVFQKDVQQSLYDTHTLKNLRGRTIRIYDRLTDKVFKFGYAWKNQSTVSDIVNPQGLIPLYEDPFYALVVIMNQIHDSLEMQFLIAKEGDFLYCAEALQRLVANLEVPLEAHGRTFVIPAEVEAGSFCEGVKVDVKRDLGEVAGALEAVYAAL